MARRRGSAPFRLEACAPPIDTASPSGFPPSSPSPPGFAKSVRGAPLLVGSGFETALPADQQGWRNAADEPAAKVQTFRRWARDNAGRVDVEDEGGTVLGADIVLGMWTCCMLNERFRDN